MKKLEITPGEKYNRLTFVKPTGKSSFWVVKCDCGKEVVRRPSHIILGTTTSCGCRKLEAIAEQGRKNKGINHPMYGRKGKKSPHYGKRGPLSPNWKGGRFKVQGYVYVYDPDHPNSNRKGYVREHVKKMSNKLGRGLLPGETVHHKNGVRDDNHQKNLKLLILHPPGQSVSDLVKWAREILRRYG